MPSTRVTQPTSLPIETRLGANMWLLLSGRGRVAQSADGGASLSGRPGSSAQKDQLRYDVLAAEPREATAGPSLLGRMSKSKISVGK